MDQQTNRPANNTLLFDLQVKDNHENGQSSISQYRNCGIDPSADTCYSKYHWLIRVSSTTYMILTIILSFVLGRKNGQISAQYQLYPTPPGLFFAIWAVIYFGVAVVNIMNLYYNIWSIRAHFFLFIVNTMLTMWSAIFDIGTNQSVFASSAILIQTVPMTFKLWKQMGTNAKYNWFIILSRNVYAFFLGWIIAAANLAMGIWIVYWWNGSKQTQTIVFWVITPICAIGGTALNFYLDGKYGLYSCLALWISVTWAFIGAGINSSQCLNGTGGQC